MSLSRDGEVTKHVPAFNRAVPSGEWGAFVEGLAPVPFAWDKGGTGTKRLLWEGGLVTELGIAFDGP